MKFSSLLLPVALFTTGVAAVPATYAQAPMAAQAPAPGVAQNPLLKGITLTADQKAKVQTIQTKYQQQGQQMMMQLQQKYGSQLQAIQSGPGTQQEKQTKAKPIVRAMIKDAAPLGRTTFNKMADEVGGVMTPAQKPQFNKNRAAALVQMDARIKAAQAQMK